MLDLVTRADVVVQNFRPGVAEKMGFGYEALAAGNPGLIYCNISGFGHGAARCRLPGFRPDRPGDVRRSCPVTETAATGPLRAGIAVGDSVTGVFAAVGVRAALGSAGRDR